MKKLNAAVNPSDRIIIVDVSSRDEELIQYFLIEAKTRCLMELGEPFKFSLSVKRYFGENGRTVRELTKFNEWYNPRLQTEMKRIWRALEAQCPVKAAAPCLNKPARRAYDDERAA